MCIRRYPALLSALVLLSLSALAENQVTVTPPPFQGILTNPAMGVASFHNGYGEPPPGIEDYPDTGIEYVRFYWSELEPQEGHYNFTPVDDAFNNADHHPQPIDVGLRIMALDEPTTGSKIPLWLIEKGVKGTWTADKNTFIPDLNDPIFLDYANRLLAALGKRYDGNPRLAYIDIGLVGSWGEWHNSNFTNIAPLDQRYTAAELNRYVDMHNNAFPKTPKIMLINGGEALAYAAKHGAGWRADCWGDWHNFSASWSHMRDDYPQRLKDAQASWSGFSQAWEHAPVSLEICGYMAQWQSVQHYTRQDVQATFDWALAQHASTLNLKSRPVPQEYRDILDNALKKLGYRFRVVSLTHEKTLKPGQVLTVSSLWSNDGVAPLYLPYRLNWRLVDQNGHEVTRAVAGANLQSWLPGEHLSQATLSLPASLNSGEYRLQAALLNSEGKARIKLANSVPQTDNWYSLSIVSVN